MSLPDKYRILIFHSNIKWILPRNTPVGLPKAFQRKTNWKYWIKYIKPIWCPQQTQPVLYDQWPGIMKNREAPEFTIHTHVAGKLSDIQGLFHISSMYLLYAVFHEIIGLSIKIHKDIRCILTTTQNFIFVREAMKTNNNFSITGIGSLPHAPCIHMKHSLHLHSLFRLNIYIYI